MDCCCVRCHGPTRRPWMWGHNSHLDRRDARRRSVAAWFDQSRREPYDAFEPAGYLPPGGYPPVALPPSNADYRLPPLAPAADYGPAAIVAPDEPGSAPGFAAGHWRSAGVWQIGAVLSVGS
jgi:hypothetical protein